MSSPQSSSDNNTNEEDQFFDPNLFINEEYSISEFSHKDIRVTFHALQSASTDYNLTGQVIWPACQVLSKFLIDNSHLVAGRTVLELGSGAGLAGICAGIFAERAILSDHEDIVLRLIRKNIADCKISIDGGSSFRNISALDCCRLSWGDEAEMRSVKEQFCGNDGSGFDVIIGADVCYWPNAIDPLMRTIDSLLSSTGIFLLSYVSRAGLIDRLLHETASRFGFTSELVVDVDNYYNSISPQKALVWIIRRGQQQQQQQMMQPQEDHQKVQLHWIEEPATSEHDRKLWEGVLQLRFQVLRKPLGHPPGSEHNKLDIAGSHHLMAFMEHSTHVQVVGCVSLHVFTPDDPHFEEYGAKFYQMAVHPDFQRQHIGSMLIRELIRKAREEFMLPRVACHAREVAAPFYEKLAFSRYGERFEEVGIPHFKMRIELK